MLVLEYEQTLETYLRDILQQSCLIMKRAVEKIIPESKLTDVEKEKHPYNRFRSSSALNELQWKDIILELGATLEYLALDTSKSAEHTNDRKWQILRENMI